MEGSPGKQVLTVNMYDRPYKIFHPGGLIGHALELGNPYECPVLEHIRSMELEGTALDVGAHVGNHTLWLSMVCGLHVIAVEPIVPDRLQENVALNELNGEVEVWPFALANRNGVVSVLNAPKHVAPIGLERGQAVAHKLDNLNVRDLVLMKIDVEGMEPDVLLGGRDTIKRHRPFIFAEAQDDAAHHKLATLLESWRYEHVNTWGATPLEEWHPCK